MNMSNINISSNFIKKLKQQIISSRYVVAKLANAEMLRLYFSIGKTVEDEFEKNKWGAKVIEDISSQLQMELPGVRGFLGKNIEKMRSFYKAWKVEPSICSSLTSKFEKSEKVIYSSLTSDINKQENLFDNKIEKSNKNNFISVSFTHHYEIILKTESEVERWYYIEKVAQNFWSVRHLRTELNNKSHLHERGESNNFKKTLPDILSNKALKVFKDQYLLDFVNIEDADDEIDERVLENEIVNNIRKFLMSLGNEFSFMGNQRNATT